MNHHYLTTPRTSFHLFFSFMPVGEGTAFQPNLFPLPLFAPNLVLPPPSSEPVSQLPFQGKGHGLCVCAETAASFGKRSHLAASAHVPTYELDSRQRHSRSRLASWSQLLPFHMGRSHGPFPGRETSLILCPWWWRQDQVWKQQRQWEEGGRASIFPKQNRGKGERVQYLILL